jgi:N,N'-diacetyllegionaminate synthase
MIDIIAELGLIHEGSIGQAKHLIKAAAASGATIVKLQTHIAEEETTRYAPAPYYFKNESRFEYFKRTAFTIEQYCELKEYSISQGVDLISSPFSEKALEMLLEVGMSAVKIPSGEVSNIPLLEKIAKSGIRVFLSSGMSSEEEIHEAYTVLARGCKDITLMQCTSLYPCPPEKVGLNLIDTYKDKYNCRLGFSDHTLDYYAAIASVLKGATVIEKHFTLSKLMYGPDPQHSFEPSEFKLYSDQIIKMAKAMASPLDKNEEAKNLKFMKDTFEKSIVAKQDLKAGTILNLDHIAFKKPGTGMPAKLYKEILGKKITRDLQADDMITLKELDS